MFQQSSCASPCPCLHSESVQCVLHETGSTHFCHFTPPMNCFNATRYVVCSLSRSLSLTCHLLFIFCFRNHSPLMSFGASFVSFLVSPGATCFRSTLQFHSYCCQHLCADNNYCKCPFENHICCII